MTEEIYKAPDSDVSQQTPLQQPTRRASTTTFGWILLILGGLGLLIAGLGAVMTMQLDVEMDGISNSDLIIDALLSLISKFGLLASGLGLIMRAKWLASALKVGLILSLADSCFKAINIISVQASKSGDSATELGVYIGFYSVSAFSIAIYVGIMFYIKTAASKIEFN